MTKVHLHIFSSNSLDTIRGLAANGKINYASPVKAGFHIPSFSQLNPTFSKLNYSKLFCIEGKIACFLQLQSKFIASTTSGRFFFITHRTKVSSFMQHKHNSTIVLISSRLSKRFSWDLANEIPHKLECWRNVLYTYISLLNLSHKH